MITINEKNMEEQFILIVDNSPLDRKKFSEEMKEEGFYLRFVPDAETALKTVVKTRPFLILIDLIMPKMDSYTFTRILKNDEDTSDIMIIALCDKNPDHNKIIYSGFDGFIYTNGSSTDYTGEIRKVLTKKKKTIITKNPGGKNHEINQ